MAAPSYTYTLTNGSTADASQVMQNYNDILNGVTDGTKDLSINALTCAGTATLNGDVNLGNASGDTLSITASLGSNIPVKTNNAYDLGSASLKMKNLYAYGLLFNTGAGTLAAYGTGSFTATFSTATGTPSDTWYYTLIGALVIIQMGANVKQFTKNGSGTVDITGLPTAILPSTTVACSPIYISYNDVGVPVTYVLGACQATTAGISFYRDIGQDSFGNATQNSLTASTIVYVLR